VRALITALALLVVDPAWAEEPTGFAEFRWGTASHRVDEGLHGKCTFNRATEEFAFCTCYHVPSVGAVKVAFWSIPDPGGNACDAKLAGYSIMLRASGYASLRSVAIEKFGAPTTSRFAEYTTGAGFKVSGEIVSWVGPGATAHLSERCDTVTESCLSVRTKRGNDLIRGRLESDRAKAKKAF
jgi:hypothetical protein